MITPIWYSASTKRIAEKALERGVLKYPGLCYIRDINSMAWVSIENQLEYIKGDNQITDVKYENSMLQFYNGETLLFSYDISITDEDKNNIVEEVKRTIGLDNYVKTSDLSKVLDDIIGNLPDNTTVVDYLNSLSYNKLADVPITNLIGTLSIPIIISSLDDGIYNIKGQCSIGNNTTINSCADGVLYLVSHDLDNPNNVSITKIYGKNITLYFVQEDGSYTTDKYVTESWINAQDYASAASVKEYVRNVINETIMDIIDERINSAIDKKIVSINSDELSNIFN